MESRDTIRITHFINPHMFWYKPVSAYVHNLEEKRFQLDIDAYCEENFQQGNTDRIIEFFPGETIAVLDFDRNKWCRCVIDDVTESKGGEREYSLWSMDDGVPIVSNSRYMHPLPERFTSDARSKVQRGAVKNLLPSELFYDQEADRFVPRILSRWDSNAVSILEGIIKNSASIEFKNVTMHKINNALVFFGDLEFVTRRDKFYIASRVLKDLQKATEVEPAEFMSRITEIQTMTVKRSGPSDQESGSDHGRRDGHSPVLQIQKSSANDILLNGGRGSRASVSSGGGLMMHEGEDMNGLKDEDFDESASVIKPRNVIERRAQRQQQQQQQSVHYQSPPLAKANANNKSYREEDEDEDDSYPVSSDRTKCYANADLERKGWHQENRPPKPESLDLTNMRNALPETPLRVVAQKARDDDVTTTTVTTTKPTRSSIMSKLQMRKRQKESPTSSNIPENSAGKSAGNSLPFNIVPAGYSMGNVAFDKGKLVTRNSSFDTTEAYPIPMVSSKQQNSPSPTPPAASAPKAHSPPPELAHSSIAAASAEDHQPTTIVNSVIEKHYNPQDPADGGQTYITKGSSRFDRAVEEEAW